MYLYDIYIIATEDDDDGSDKRRCAYTHRAAAPAEIERRELRRKRL